ncbi:unnamed protein product [Parascedosporium putredinis]|uniref:Uncharacterized protein n=1 Tax=Parascedosporium putredinis TaxID=1442378 RepID=A0A9P1MC03_9PEZI|nr:unnamed protein product [Parascedosporium putredinis]CAI7995741.1 unnamed protein product [Parascedosporium putredinis]
MAPRKNRCNFKECPSAAQRIVGDCGFCRGHFAASTACSRTTSATALKTAKSNPTSEMPHSSKASAPRSLRVYNEDYDDDDDDELASTGSSSPDTVMGGS